MREALSLEAIRVASLRAEQQAGENESAVVIAESESSRRVREANARQTYLIKDNEVLEAEAVTSLHLASPPAICLRACRCSRRRRCRRRARRTRCAARAHLEAHLQVEAGKLGHVPMSERALRAEDRPNLKDLSHVRHQHHLFVQLR